MSTLQADVSAGTDTMQSNARRSRKELAPISIRDRSQRDLRTSTIAKVLLKSSTIKAAFLSFFGGVSLSILIATPIHKHANKNECIKLWHILFVLHRASIVHALAWYAPPCAACQEKIVDTRTPRD